MMFLEHDRGHRHATLLALHRGIEMVLDRIVGPTGHVLCHLGPFRAHPAIEFEDPHVLFMCEGCFVD